MMHSTEKLIKDLRFEYREVQEKITAAKFALATLPFDEEEQVMLSDQVLKMEWYADVLLERAKYAKTKQREAE